eukprot:c23552_g1_i1 orf=80-1684(+)
MLCVLRVISLGFELQSVILLSLSIRDSFQAVLTMRHFFHFHSNIWVAVVVFRIVTLSQCLGYWVSVGSKGLVYQTLPNGDRIMDFSSVGYRGGNRSFPSSSPVVTLHPSGDNDAFQLQRAIAKVSQLPVDATTGLRGTIKLASGHFDVRGASLAIRSSGIVIEGNGTDEHSGSVLHSNSSSHNYPLFDVSGSGTLTEVPSRANITRTVPSGTQLIRVDNITDFSVGQEVLVCWPQTAAWIQMMNMTEAWVNRTNFVTTVERTITNINWVTMEIKVDIPIPFRIDLRYLGGNHKAYITHFENANIIREVGLSNFRAINEVRHPYGGGTFLNILTAQDSWANNLIALDFGGDTMKITGKRITLQNVQLIRTIPAPPKGPKPADLALAYPASQVLVRNTISKGDHEFNFITRDGANGPNVFYNCTCYGSAKAQPHSHWATGLLYDNVNLPSGDIEFINRNILKSKLDHGIAVGYGVVWHTNTSSLTIINPPDAANWAIGYTTHSTIKPTYGNEGILDPLGIQSPKLTSLYMAQLDYG